MKLPRVSIILIHYNRINHLKSTLNSLLSIIKYPNLEIIIADDFSEKEIREELLSINCDILIINQKNFGLGKNTNNALKVCTGEYILHLQDDWDFIGEKYFLENSISLFENNETIDLIRYYNTNKYPKGRIINDQGYYEIASLKQSNYDVMTLYSDTPHLKRNKFHVEYGLFKENVPMTDMEINFASKYSKRRKGIVVFANNDQFIHTGANFSFNPGAKKQRLLKKILRYRLGSFLYKIYKK